MCLEQNVERISASKLAEIKEEFVEEANKQKRVRPCILAFSLHIRADQRSYGALLHLPQERAEIEQEMNQAMKKFKKEVSARDKEMVCSYVL